ncbi:homeobox protein knotted-1-like LET12 isoform X1 [Tanacetum coccineum]
MALHHYSDHHHLPENIDTILPPPSSPKTSQSPPPTWLNSAILSQHNTNSYTTHADVTTSPTNFLHLQTTNSDSSNSNWLSPRVTTSSLDHHHHRDSSSMFGAPADGNNNDHTSIANEHKLSQRGVNDNGSSERNWEFVKCKADILSHPMYDQLLSAHVSCLRIATPVDQLPRIDAQLAQTDQVLAKYSVFGNHNQPVDDKELNQFMAHYVVLLSSFKEQLQQHVRVHAMEAVMACVAPGEGTGATMSDDDEEQVESDANLFDGGLDVSDSMGFGLPTESERSLMERVRQELKHELKQGYKSENCGNQREKIQ